MSKFEHLEVGDIVYVTGIEANLYECNDDNYDALLSVVNQECKVVEVADDVELYNLSDVSSNDHCLETPQRGVLIQSPKLQGHNGGGRCPEFNCYWIGKDYLSFESISVDVTMDIFDKLNESDDFGWAEEIIKDIPDVVDYRTVKQGEKVVPGKNWMFGNQAQGSVYGIVDMEQYGGEPAYIEDSTDEEFWQYWVHVDWVNKNGKLLFRNNYRVGPDYHDLKYYVPKPTKKKKIREGSWEERYKSKRYTQKFNIGDRVVLNGTVGGKNFNNELGTVLKYKFTGGGAGHPHRVYLILFDNWRDKNNFLMSPVQADQNREFIDSRCREGGCWYSVSDNLEPAPDVSGVFDSLNESEEDDFGWAEEIINQEYHRYGEILPHLDVDDIISITGDFTDDGGDVLLSVEDEPFKVFSTSHPMRKNKTVYLKWVKPGDERPVGWSNITNDSEEVHMGDSTFEWDEELMVKILHKEDHPF